MGQAIPVKPTETETKIFCQKLAAFFWNMWTTQSILWTTETDSKSIPTKKNAYMLQKAMTFHSLSPAHFLRISANPKQGARYWLRLQSKTTACSVKRTLKV